jgi:hypothetical protein
VETKLRLVIYPLDDGSWAVLRPYRDHGVAERMNDEDLADRIKMEVASHGPAYIETAKDHVEPLVIHIAVLNPRERIFVVQYALSNRASVMDHKSLIDVLRRAAVGPLYLYTQEEKPDG